jgi:hypothetical protein
VFCIPSMPEPLPLLLDIVILFSEVLTVVPPPFYCNNILIHYAFTTFPLDIIRNKTVSGRS